MQCFVETTVEAKEMRTGRIITKAKNIVSIEKWFLDMNCDTWRYKTMIGLKNVDKGSAALNYG